MQIRIFSYSYLKQIEVSSFCWYLWWSYQETFIMNPFNKTNKILLMNLLDCVPESLKYAHMDPTLNFNSVVASKRPKQVDSV